MALQGLIKTNSGMMLDIFNIHPDQIDIKDIAHGLSHTARFCGQTGHFYSVAEHSIAVCMLVPKQDQLAALLHDASEAYIGDIISPIIHLLPQYQEMESRLMEAIAQKFRFMWPIPESVKIADSQMLQIELVEQFKPIDQHNRPLTPAMVKLYFLEIFYQLTNT
jgi:hypothetical protein